MSASPSINASSAVLWASAFVLAALILVQAGRMSGNTALAGGASDRGSYTVLTASTGIGDQADPDQVVFVIDSIEQIVLVYEIENASERRILLRGGGSLDNLFRNAR